VAVRAAVHLHALMDVVFRIQMARSGDPYKSLTYRRDVCVCINLDTSAK
jgi:hypothetical protein